MIDAGIGILHNRRAEMLRERRHCRAEQQHRAENGGARCEGHS
jgi:hypothetical protein